MSRFRVPLSVLAALVIALAAMAVGGRGVTFSAPAHQSAAPTSPRNYMVTVGYGQDDWAANIYNPHTINIYVGDSITWVNQGLLEPHTISFGPMPLLRKLFQQTVVVTPQKAGPPVVSLNPQLGFATKRTTYNGTGYANSGLLTKGKRWTITFTRAGTYHYHCLIHFPGMTGVVKVHPRPAVSKNYYVRTGYGSDSSGADVFFPEVLTIHVGDTVHWYGAIFHTVTFAPMATIDQLRKQFIIPKAQKNGPPQLTVNPATAFPTGGTTYNGTGIVSSGILQPPKNSFALTFTAPGTYHYGCLVHPGMDGTIRVLP